MTFKKPRAVSNHKWTSEEEARLLALLRNGAVLHEISLIFKDRSETSLENKLRKFRVKYDLFGDDHRNEKYRKTAEWLDKVKPQSVFEAFAGHGNLTKLYIQQCGEVHSCEQNSKIFDDLVANVRESTHSSVRRRRICGNRVVDVLISGKIIRLINSDAQKWASYMYSTNKFFDYVDLDACGTVLPSIPLFLRLLKRGFFSLTMGEFHSYRLGRKDVLLKSVPVLFKFGKKITLRKMHSQEEFYNLLIGWVCLNGAFSISYDELRAVDVEEIVKLGKTSGVFRVLFRINKANSLAEILNNSAKYLRTKAT